jgi:hypothetical protein
MCVNINLWVHSDKVCGGVRFADDVQSPEAHVRDELGGERLRLQGGVCGRNGSEHVAVWWQYGVSVVSVWW